MTSQNPTKQTHPERGSALIYILVAIALLAALTVSFMEPSSQQGNSQNTFKTVSDVSSQIEFIRAAVQECVLTYPAGDDTISVTGDEANANESYPINPSSSHYVGATIGPLTPAGNRSVSGIRCPGNPGNDKNHAPIFTAASGKFLPPPTALFEPWQWYNNTDGVFFWIETKKGDAYLRSALEKLDAEYSGCETDMIDATAGDENLVSDEPSIICPSGSLCFRVHMITHPGSLFYGAELAANCGS